TEVHVIDLNEIVSGAQRMLRRLIEASVEIETQLSDEPVYVEADETRLEQVLLNLALNARDAMPGGGRLGISTRVLDGPDGRRAQLSVRDTGSGIDRETQTRIFEPFFTTKEPGKGTGLGLATVYGIVQDYGGAIDVESE